ncbi:MAG: HepT-like ribonuclease domain-containing protein [Steroidobacteraceae bacterium]
MTSSKPAARYLDIRRNIEKIRDYLSRGGGLEQVLADQAMPYDAIRMCFLEISEAAAKLGALAELHEPDIPWSAIRGFGNHLRHSYDEIDLNAVDRAVADIDRLDAACARAIERLQREIASPS